MRQDKDIDCLLGCWLSFIYKKEKAPKLKRESFEA